MDTCKVGDYMDRSAPTFTAHTTVHDIFRTIAETDATFYPVRDHQGQLIGVIGLNELKESFAAEGMSDWLVAYDLMEPVPDVVSEDTPLAEAVERMRAQELDFLPVVAGTDSGRLVGMLELRAVRRRLSQEILRRKRLAEANGTFGQDA
jgi:CBS domain-containing protein